MARQRRAQAFWRRHVAAFEASGQTRAAYCSAHPLSGSTLDYWRRRLRSERDGTTGKASLPAFVPVQIKAATPDLDRAAVVLDWPGGMRMHVARDADPAWLAQVLSGLH
jgi:transposase-like protein